MTMTEQDKVKMRVDVDPDFRNRVKALAFRMGITMGELIEQVALSEDSIPELEASYANPPTNPPSPEAQDSSATRLYRVKE
jgi:hypothetical protein